MKRLLLPMLLLTACGLSKTPTTFPEQAKAALSASKNLGHVDATLQPVAGKERSWSTRTRNVSFEYISNAGGKMCVHLTTSEQYFRSHGSVEARLDQFTQASGNASVVFGAYDSLDGQAWPDRSGGVTGTVVDHKLERHWLSTEEHLDSNGTERLSVTVEWCGAAPAVHATSHYLTATVFGSDSAPNLYVWAIDGTPTE